EGESRRDEVERRRGPGQRLGRSLAKRDVADAVLDGAAPSLLEHLGGQVHRRHPPDGGRESPGQQSRTGGDVEDFGLRRERQPRPRPPQILVDRVPPPRGRLDRELAPDRIVLVRAAVVHARNLALDGRPYNRGRMSSRRISAPEFEAYVEEALASVPAA